MNAALNRILDFFLNILDLFRFWVVLYEYERGLILRFGKHVRTLGPGFHWRLPFRIEELRYVNVRRKSADSWDMTLTTGAGDTVSFSYAMLIEVIDSDFVLLNLDDWARASYAMAKIAIAEVVEVSQDITTQKFVDHVHEHMNKRLSEIGVKATDFAFQDKAPTIAVKLFNGAR